MHICTCKYPLMIVDKRDGIDVDYLSIPVEVIEGQMGGDMISPNIDVEDRQGLDGVTRTYVKVTWRKLDHDGTKEYDINDHIVVAGCNEKDIACDTKGTYIVFHPMDEWLDHHIIELEARE